MKWLLIALACMGTQAASAADWYEVKDRGAFAPTHYPSADRPMEFFDRYGWRSYEAEFRFGFDEKGRKITSNSTVDISVFKRDGSHWEYRCKNKHGQMRSNINFLYGKGVSILIECQIPPDKFAKAVGLDEDLVGWPTLVFEAVLKDGGATAGARKGLYILTGGQIEVSDLRPYATESPDPSNLAVLFASQYAHPHRSYLSAGAAIP